METRNYGARLDVRDHKSNASDPLYSARVVAKYWGHGGYNWFAVMSDGALMCAECVRKNWRAIVEASRDPRDHSGWRVVGFTNDGEMDEPDYCSNCNREINTEVAS